MCALAGREKGRNAGWYASLIPGWSNAIRDDVTESAEYMVGHVACGIAFPYASLARDFSADMMRGDYAGAALQSLGYLGSVRNIFATTDVIPAFIAKHPQKVDSGLEIMNHLWRQGIYHLELPLATKVGMLDNAFEGAVTRLNGQGVADDVVVAVYERGGNLGKTMRAGERSDGKIVWLEEGTSKWGWQHIVEGHKSQITTKFGPKTDQEIQNMIYNTMISPDQVITKPGIEYQYIKMYTDVSGNLKEFSVIVSDMTGGIGLGNVVTAHPGI